MRRPTSIVSASIIAAACLSSTAARADGTLFGAVSSYVTGFDGSGAALLTITGVPVGASAATAVSGSVSTGPLADGCERAILVMLNRPGRFTLAVALQGTSVSSCTLTQSP